MRNKSNISRKSVLLSFTLLVALLAQAKDRTVVVRGGTGVTTGKTEVTIHEGEGTDTITVTPGTDVTTITVTVRDLDGVLIQHDVLSATGDYLEFSTPSSDNGCVVTLRDDNGVVYEEYDD